MVTSIPVSEPDFKFFLCKNQEYSCACTSVNKKAIAKLLFLSSLLKYFLYQLRYNLQVYKVFKIFHDNLWKSLEQDNLKLQFPAYTCGNDGDKITIIQDHMKNQSHKRECQISQHIFFLLYLTCEINLKS